MLTVQKGISLKVFYSLLPDQQQQGSGFGVPFSWDIPMLEGYAWEALPNSVRSPSLSGFFGISAPMILSLFQKEKPDVVIITGWQSLPLLQALWACMRLRIPRIVRGESNAMRTRPWWVRLVHKIMLSRFSAFLTIGRANKEFYLGYGVPEGRMFECNYFIDNQWFRERLDGIIKDRDAIRAHWGIEKSHLCFLYAGKLIPKKSVLDLLKALEMTCRKRENMHALIVGTGELMGSARQYIAKRQLPVTFAGFLNQTEIISAYAAADCLVLPSDYGETWGLVVNEAMACGLPAIVSDRVGCGPDLVENGITGYIFPFGNVEALAARLLEMASNIDNRLQMGRNAHKKIEEYSVEKAVEGTLQAIDYVMERADHH
jgi:glycosyltransferase involved in cell wall biosynthesis